MSDINWLVKNKLYPYKKLLFKGSYLGERQFKEFLWKWGIILPSFIWFIVAFLFILEITFFGEHRYLGRPVIHWSLIIFGLLFSLLSLYLAFAGKQNPLYPILRRLSFAQRHSHTKSTSTTISDMYGKIFEHIPMSILTCDKNGTITAVNSYYATLSAKEMDNVLGQSLLEKKWIKEMGLKQKYQHLLKEGIPFKEHGLLYVTDDGMERFLDVMAVPTRDEHGNITGFVSMAQDSTQMNVYGKKMVQQTEQLYILNQVTQAINSTRDISEILWIILRNIVKLFGEANDTYCSIIMLESGYTYAKEAYPPQFNSEHVKTALPSSKGIVGHVFRTKQPYYSNDVQNDPYYVNKGQEGPFITQSELVIPIFADNAIIALINIESTKKNKFAPEDIDLMRTFANNIAIALTNANLYTELRQSEEKFRNLVNNSIAGIYIIQDDVFKYVNPAFQNMFGYQEEELLQTSYKEIVASDQHAIFGKLEGEYSEIKEGETFSLVGVRKDGREIDIEGKFTYTFYDGKPAVQGFALDVTRTKRAVEALRESEKKYSDLVERAHDGIVIIQDETFVFVNAAFLRIFKVSELETIGSNCYRIFTTESQKKLRAFFSSSIEERLSSPYLELQSEFNTKEKKYFALNIGMIDYLGRSAYIVVLRDDTNRKKLEENIKNLNRDLEKKVFLRTQELKIANEQLKEAIDLKSKFIANSSHELRTPLTIIKGNLELALMHHIDVEQKELLDAINTEVDHMTHILSELSILTKADSLEYQTIKTGPVLLDHVLVKAIKSMEVLAKQKQIQLVNQKLPQAFIKGNEEYLDRLFHNLLSNAIKYGKSPGQVKVQLQEQDDMYVISVEDDGIGIAKQELPYIFERFYRTKEARALQETGTGLGLAIVQWIVQAHQGRIYVKSEEGKGTTFTVYFPKMQSQPDNT